MRCCSAGVTVYTPVNGTHRATVLLPGTYTSASAVTANTSLLAFGTSSTAQASAGFTGTGSLSSAYTVALQPGLTTYPSPLYEGSPAYTALSTWTGAISNSTEIDSFLLSSNMRAVLSVGGSSGSRVVAWESVANVGNMVGGSGGVKVLSLQSSSCSTPCASGGVCMANSTCVCQPGFTGSTCSAFPSLCARLWGPTLVHVYQILALRDSSERPARPAPLGAQIGRAHV